MLVLFEVETKFQFYVALMHVFVFLRCTNKNTLALNLTGASNLVELFLFSSRYHLRHETSSPSPADQGRTFSVVGNCLFVVPISDLSFSLGR